MENLQTSTNISISSIDKHNIRKLCKDVKNDAGGETQQFFNQIERENELKEFRSTGTHLFHFDIPENTRQVKLRAIFSNDDMGKARTTAMAYAAFSPKVKSSSSANSQLDQQFFIHVRSSTKSVKIGNYVVFHVKCNFPFPSFDWFIVSKDIIWNSGRELGNNIHPEIKTFSVVVSTEMSPGFHIIVYTRVPKSDQIIADSAYVPIDTVSGIHPHKIQFKVMQKGIIF